MSSSTEKKWVCKYCTYENWPSAIKCTLCRGSKRQHVIADDRNIYNLMTPECPAQLVNRQQLQLNVANVDPFRKWICPACTYRNWPKANRCVQCYTVRRRATSPPVAAAQSSPSPDAVERSPSAVEDAMAPATPTCTSVCQRKWACAACTYENWPKATKCVICEMSRVKNSDAVEEDRRRLTKGVSQRVASVALTEICGGPDEGHDPSGAGAGAGAGTSASTAAVPTTPPAATNNYEQEMRLRKLRQSMRDADWPWLKACLAVVDGDLAPVESYLASGGDPSRQLTSSEASLLSRPSAFDAGHTLVHLAIRFQREDLLCVLLAAAEGGPQGLKRVPSHVSPDLAADIRRHVTACLRQRKGDFPCFFVTDLVTFSLPADVDELTADVQEHLFDELLDRDVQKELEVESPIINWSLELTERLGSRLYALWNRTAGDCLLDSVLQATWGVFDRESTLRRALSDSLNEAAAMFYPRWKEYEAMQAQLLHFSLDESQWQQDWSLLLSLAGQPGASLEQLHVFAVAHILRRPIIVYGVKFVKSFRGEAIGYARFEGIYLPLLWEQSFCWKTPIALGYTRGHFSALVPMEPDSDENVCAGADLGSNEDVQVAFMPLMTSDGKLLPIHFLPNSEIGREEEIMRQWLECCVTEGGILVAQQKIPRRPLLVAQMVEEWLNHYRRLCHVQPPLIRAPSNLHGQNQNYASDGDSDDE